MVCFRGALEDRKRGTLPARGWLEQKSSGSYRGKLGMKLQCDLGYHNFTTCSPLSAKATTQEKSTGVLSTLLALREGGISICALLQVERASRDEVFAQGQAAPKWQRQEAEHCSSDFT